MDERRRGQIALAVLKHYLREGVLLSQDSLAELVKVAGAIGISVEELRRFARPLVQGLVDEVFALEPEGSGFRDGVSDSDT